MRMVVISVQDQLHGQLASVIAYGTCLKGPQAWGLMRYNCLLNNSNVFNYSGKWGRLGSLVHIHLCLLLPLPVLDYLLPPSLLAFPWALLLPFVHKCARCQCTIMGRVLVGLCIRSFLIHSGTKHILAQKLQSLGLPTLGGLGQRACEKGRFLAQLLHSIWGISLMAGRRGTWQPVHFCGFIEL